MWSRRVMRWGEHAVMAERCGKIGEGCIERANLVISCRLVYNKRRFCIIFFLRRLRSLVVGIVIRQELMIEYILKCKIL